MKIIAADELSVVRWSPSIASFCVGSPPSSSGRRSTSVVSTLAAGPEADDVAGAALADAGTLAGAEGAGVGGAEGTVRLETGEPPQPETSRAIASTAMARGAGLVRSDIWSSCAALETGWR